MAPRPGRERDKADIIDVCAGRANDQTEEGARLGLKAMSSLISEMSQEPYNILFKH